MPLRVMRAQLSFADELHTNVPPRSMHLVDGDPTRRQCTRQCHGQLWLVDGGSGFVNHVAGKAWAIACGPASSRGFQVFPGLCIAVPAAPDAAPDGAEEDEHKKGEGEGEGEGEDEGEGEGEGEGEAHGRPREGRTPGRTAVEELTEDHFIPLFAISGAGQ
jgi:hypothetical protein